MAKKGQTNLIYWTGPPGAIFDVNVDADVAVADADVRRPVLFVDVLRVAAEVPTCEFVEFCTVIGCPYPVNWTTEYESDGGGDGWKGAATAALETEEGWTIWRDEVLTVYGAVDVPAPPLLPILSLFENFVGISFKLVVGVIDVRSSIKLLRRLSRLIRACSDETPFLWNINFLIFNKHSKQKL